MILLIDNYDSFTYNLYQVLASMGAAVEVKRNDAVDVTEARAMQPRGVVISPGPGDPGAAGVSCELIAELGGATPILGVCLGLQCIAAAFGGRIIRAPTLMHGKTSIVQHDGQGVYAGLPAAFQAVRYHSLSVDPASAPACLTVTSRSDDGVIMGMRHRSLPIEGVQFHPESVLTLEGPHLLANFLRACGEIA